MKGADLELTWRTGVLQDPDDDEPRLENGAAVRIDGYSPAGLL